MNKLQTAHNVLQPYCILNYEISQASNKKIYFSLLHKQPTPANMQNNCEYLDFNACSYNNYSARIICISFNDCREGSHLQESGDTMIFKFEAQAPKIDEKAYAFNTATLIGKVELKEYASVWPA